MKKIAIVIAMVCFAMSLSALDVEFKPSLAVSGSAKATVGFNLDTNNFGMKNTFDTDITFTFLGEQSPENKGEGTYGYVKLKDVKFTVDSDDFKKDLWVASAENGPANTKINLGGFTMNEAKVIAKLVSGPLYLQIMDEGNVEKLLEFGGFSLKSLSDNKFLKVNGKDSPITTDAQKAAAAIKGAYLYTGYDSDMIDVNLKLSTPNGYCGAAVQTTQWYIAPDAAVTVADLTVKAGGVFGAGDGVPTTFKPGVGVSAEYKVALTETISLVPGAGFDMILSDPAKWSAGGVIKAIWGAKDKYKPFQVAKDGDCPSSYKLDGDDIEHQGGVSVSANYTSSSLINLVAQVVEQRGDAGLVPGLGAALTFEVADLTAKTKMTTNVGAFVNYTMKMDAIEFTPYARLVYKQLEATSLGIGAELAKVFPNVSFYADFNSYNLSANTSVTPNVAQTKGLISGGIKISF